MGAEVYPGVHLKAAALLESLARNHPLVDGNKRTAATLAFVFLRLNGLRHTLIEDEAFNLIVGVASGQIAVEMCAQLLADHTAQMTT